MNYRMVKILEESWASRRRLPAPVITAAVYMRARTIFADHGGTHVGGSLTSEAYTGGYPCQGGPALCCPGCS